MQQFTGWLDTYYSHSEASGKFSRASCESLEAYRGASVSFHLHLEPDLTTGLKEFLMQVAQFVSETAGAHRTRIL